jgi:hypothetical protein
MLVGVSTTHGKPRKFMCGQSYEGECCEFNRGAEIIESRLDGEGGGGRSTPTNRERVYSLG